jgi:hypothetical protein
MNLTETEKTVLSKLKKTEIDLTDSEITQMQDYDLRYQELFTIFFWQGNKDKEHSFTINLN